MINLRYHLESIVAVFLALGIGIALGTSFIDGVVVDRLERSLDDLRSERDANADRVDELEGELEADATRLVDLRDALVTGAFSRRLLDQPVMIITAEGVTDDEIDQIRRAILRSGALFEGVVRFSGDLDLSDAEDVDRLAEVLEISGADATTIVAEVDERVARLFSPPEFDAVSTVSGRRLQEATSAILIDSADPRLVTPVNPVEPRDDVLLRLASAGLLEFDGAGARAPTLSSVPRVGTSFVVVSGPDMVPATTSLLQTLVLEMLRTDPAAFVVSSVAEPGVDDEFLSLFRGDGPFADRVPTIDDATSVEGIAATVMATDRIGDLAPQNYGKREDADDLMPRR